MIFFAFPLYYIIIMCYNSKVLLGQYVFFEKIN